MPYRVHNVVLSCAMPDSPHGSAPSAARRPPRRPDRNIRPGAPPLLVAPRRRAAPGRLRAADPRVGIGPGRQRPPRAGPLHRTAHDLPPAGRVAGEGVDRSGRERLVGLVVVGSGPDGSRRLVGRVDRPARTRPTTGRAATRPSAPPCLHPRRRCRASPCLRHRPRPLRALPQRHPRRRSRADARVDGLPVPARRADLRRHRPAPPRPERPRRRAERRVVAGQGGLHPRGRLLRRGPGPPRPARGRARGRHPRHPRHRTGLDQSAAGEIVGPTSSTVSPSTSTGPRTAGSNPASTTVGGTRLRWPRARSRCSPPRRRRPSDASRSCARSRSIASRPVPTSSTWGRTSTAGSAWRTSARTAPPRPSSTVSCWTRRAP